MMYEYKIIITPWPVYWKNFINSLDIDMYKIHTDFIKEIVETFYNSYKGRFFIHDGSLKPLNDFSAIASGIAFENEEDATAFILRWS